MTDTKERNRKILGCTLGSGHHVIDQRHSLGQARRDAERAAHIATARLPRQTTLGGRIALAPGMQERHAQAARQFATQPGAMVEPAFAATLRVGGHRDQGIGQRHDRHGRDEQARQQGARAGLGRELETLEQHLRGILVAQRCPRDIEGRCGTQAMPAQYGGARQGLGTASTGHAIPGQSGETGIAPGLPRRGLAHAERTLARQRDARRPIDPAPDMRRQSCHFLRRHPPTLRPTVDHGLEAIARTTY